MTQRPVDGPSRGQPPTRTLHDMPSPIASLAAELILEQGPLPLAQLHAVAVEREVTRSRTSSSLRQSLSAPAFVLRPDGRYDTAARLLRGCCFTTRPRRPPRDGVLWLSRDVDPLLALNAARLPLKGGGDVTPGDGDSATWVGPTGWLPDVPPGELLALSWDGAALAVTAVTGVPAVDSDIVTDVRTLLAGHASARHRSRWPNSAVAPLTAVVLSALLEEPALFSAPLPPLSELLPLPEDLRPVLDGVPRVEVTDYEVLRLPLPRRVHRELQRRADLLGDHLPDYAAMLLGAAADRLLPSPRPSYDRYSPYDDVYDDNVVAPAGWGR